MIPAATYALYQTFGELDTRRIFDDGLPTLEELQRHGIRLGVISNWDERLDKLLIPLDLARWLECTIVSCNVGFTKPASAIFNPAARASRLRPEQTLHVGDAIHNTICMELG